jgi:hypothetical protein
LQVGLAHPGFYGLSRLRGELELNGAAGLLLDDGGPFDGPTAVDDIGNLEADEIAASEFAVDRQVEQGELARVVLELEADADARDLREFQRWLLADQVAFVPRGGPDRGVRVRGNDGHGSVSPVQVGRLSIEHDDVHRLAWTGLPVSFFAFFDYYAYYRVSRHMHPRSSYANTQWR